MFFIFFKLFVGVYCFIIEPVLRLVLPVNLIFSVLFSRTILQNRHLRYLSLFQGLLCYRGKKENEHNSCEGRHENDSLVFRFRETALNL